jgi:WhiB family transcriptional regulator, redox-sensing transcriptional regulator
MTGAHDGEDGGTGRAASVVTEEYWRSAAACRPADPDLFFPVSSSGKALEQAAQAIAICARCRVRRECLAFAVKTHQMHGVWGGMSEQDRYRLRMGDGRRSADPGPRKTPQGAGLHAAADRLLSVRIAG